MLLRRNGNPQRLFHRLTGSLFFSRSYLRIRKWGKKSAGGVLLPKSAVKFERYLMGEVLSIGAEAGQVEAGKKVLLSNINAYEVDPGTEARHCFCKASDLIAVVE